MCSMASAALLFFLTYHDKIRDNAADLRIHKEEQVKVNQDVSSRLKSLENTRSLLEEIDAKLSTWIAKQEQKERKFYAR